MTASRTTWIRSITTATPGFRPHAPKRNFIVVTLYMVGFVLLLSYF